MAFKHNVNPQILMTQEKQPNTPRSEAVEKSKLTIQISEQTKYKMTDVKIDDLMAVPNLIITESPL